jgi:hypothetical protein
MRRVEYASVEEVWRVTVGCLPILGQYGGIQWPLGAAVFLTGLERLSGGKSHHIAVGLTQVTKPCVTAAPPTAEFPANRSPPDFLICLSIEAVPKVAAKARLITAPFLLSPAARVDARVPHGWQAGSAQETTYLCEQPSSRAASHAASLSFGPSLASGR